jgi:APA family basic amino acid/polyamine antiporter
VYVVAPLGIAVNLLMMLFLPVETWIRLAAWLVLGLIIYFLYGRYHSVIGRELAAPGGGTPPPDAIFRRPESSDAIFPPPE